MNENENNFESLRRLLALKRHETPPPGYFENFSSEVTARIRAGDAGRTASVSKQLTDELPWFFRLLSTFEAKPAFAGAFAFALCLFLVFGIVFAERPDSVTQPLLTQSEQTTPGGILVASAASPSGLNTQPMVQPDFLSGTSSTNPVLNTQLASPQLGGAFFGQPSPMVQQVNFALPGN
jgi:hypothetical protein